VIQIKKQDNDTFFTKWKQNHEKGILAYQIKYTVPMIIIIFLLNIFYIIKYPFKIEAFKTTIIGSVIIILIFILSNVLKWFNFEKRYKYIKNVYDENNKEI